MRLRKSIAGMMWLAIALLVFRGCVPPPKGNVIWSPDGQTALILDGQTLRFCDADGRPLAGELDNVLLAQWLGDSQQLLAARSHELRHWQRVTDLLPQAQRDAVAGVAQRIKQHLLKSVEDVSAVIALRGDALRDALGLDTQTNANVAAAAMLYLFAADDAELAEKFGAAWAQPEDFYAPVQLLQVLHRGEKGVTVVRSVFASTRRVETVNIAFDAATAAVVTESDGPDGRLELYAVTTAQAGHVLVAASSNRAPQWTDDGTSVMYTAPITPDGAPSPGALGALQRRTVRTAAGGLLDELPEPQTLAVVFFEQKQMLRAAAGKRTMMAMKDVRLPALPDDALRGEKIYTFQDGEAPSLEAIENDALATHMPEGIAAIAVNPTGEFVAAVDLKGRVCVLNQHGALIDVQLEEVKADSITEPTWRSRFELSLVLPAGHAHGDADRHAVVIWTVPEAALNFKSNTVHDGRGEGFSWMLVSADWPRELGGGFLEVKRSPQTVEGDD